VVGKSGFKKPFEKTRPGNKRDWEKAVTRGKRNGWNRLAVRKGKGGARDGFFPKGPTLQKGFKQDLKPGAGSVKNAPRKGEPPDGFGLRSGNQMC